MLLEDGHGLAWPVINPQNVSKALESQVQDKNNWAILNKICCQARVHNKKKCSQSEAREALS